MERKYLSVALRFGTESAMMLLNLIVYHPIHTHTSVFVSSLMPPISQLFGILSRRFLFFASPQKEAGKNTQCLKIWKQPPFFCFEIDVSRLFNFFSKPFWDIIAMFSVSLFALYLVRCQRNLQWHSWSYLFCLLLQVGL